MLFQCKTAKCHLRVIPMKRSLLLVCLLLVLVNVGTAYNLDDGLVAYYSFDNIQGDILKDDSGNGYDGIIYGNPKVVDGVKGMALEFDGVDDWIKLKPIIDRYESFTYIVWANPRPYYGKHWPGFIATAINGSRGGSCNNQIGIWQNTGKIHAEICTIKSDINTGTWGFHGGNYIDYPISFNTWTMYALTYNGKVAKVFVNGQVVSVFKAYGKVRADRMGLALHFSDYGIASYYNGALDEIRIYNRALSEKEIKALYEQAIKPLNKTLKVVIHNPNNYDLRNYQVRINLSDYLELPALLKVTDNNGNLLRFCYEQSNGECGLAPSRVIWVKVPFIPAKGDTIIYLKPANKNCAVNGDQVFEFYDDFNDGIVDISKWSLIGTWSENGGIITSEKCPEGDGISWCARLYSKSEL